MAAVVDEAEAAMAEATIDDTNEVSEWRSQALRFGAPLCSTAIADRRSCHLQA